MNTANLLKYYCNKVNIAKDRLEITLIAHVDEPRGKINGHQLQCSSNEFLRIDEFNEIYQGLVNAGFFIHNVFFNEIDFIDNYLKYTAHYTDESIIFTLARNGIGYNKKALIPAFCDMTGLKYTSSSSFSCSLARNKYYFSSLLNSHGIATPKTYYYAGMNNWINNIMPPNEEILIIKPSASSASQGISIHSVCSAKDSDFTDKINDIYECTKTPVIVQQYIDGIECEVPVFQFDTDVLPLNPVMIKTTGDSSFNILTEDVSENNKYSFFNLNDLFNSKDIDLIKHHASKAFQILNLTHYGRIDFRIDKFHIPYIIDVSTTPYITKHSSFSFAFESLGLDYCDIFSTIIASTL